MDEFKLKEAYIELIRLLKYMRLAETGGHAKIMVEEGRVKLNGQVEFRKRAKLKKDDVIDIDGRKIKITRAG